MPRQGKPSRSTSPQPHKPQSKSIEEVINTSPLQLHNIPALRQLKDRFTKEVQTPIDLQTSVHKAKTPQRCLQHNNVLTLYCLNDRQTLCVTCMYQSNLHKRHKVIPLNRSNKQLKQQLDGSLKGVESAVTKADGIEADSIQNIERAQREFPEILKAIRGFYGGLIVQLEQKREEQVRHVEDTWMRLQHQYVSWGQQMQRLKVYIMQRVGQLYDRPGQEHLLFNRNIASNLANINQMLRTDMCPYHSTTYMNEIKRFKEAQVDLQNKLIFTSPFEVKVSRGQSRKHKTLKESTQNFTRPKDPSHFFQKKLNQPPSNQRKTIAKVKETMKTIQREQKMAHLSPRPQRQPQLRVSVHKSPQVRSKSAIARGITR